MRVGFSASASLTSGPIYSLCVCCGGRNHPEQHPWALPVGDAGIPLPIGTTKTISRLPTVSWWAKSPPSPLPGSKSVLMNLEMSRPHIKLWEGDHTDWTPHKPFCFKKSVDVLFSNYICIESTNILACIFKIYCYHYCYSNFQRGEGKLLLILSVQTHSFCFAALPFGTASPPHHYL